MVSKWLREGFWRIRATKIMSGLRPRAFGSSVMSHGVLIFAIFHMNFTEAALTRLAVHFTGNKQNSQPLLLSRLEQELDSDSRVRLSEVLLQRFKDCHERYSFHHTSSLDYHEVYNFTKTIFGEPREFQAQSQKMAAHLYEVSLHPKIKPGELYIAFFTDILIDDQRMDALGLFKAETKSLFADIDPSA